jgi:hypothetical protein
VLNNALATQIANAATVRCSKPLIAFSPIFADQLLL